MNAIAFQIGNLTVYWYGILMVIGVLAGAYVATFQARRYGQDTERVWDALLFCLILGMVGARLYHVFSTPQGSTAGWAYYRQNPAAILRIWEGGLALLGALLGGALGLVLYTRLSRLPTLVWLDIAAPATLLAQAIGRWGNYINQELYGPPTTLPWGIPIDLAHRVAPFNDPTRYPLTTRFHPVFLYESLWCLLGFMLLWWLSERFKAWLRSGDLFWLYVIWYAVGRFAIETLRLDAWKLGPIAAAQLFCALAFVGALVALILNHRPQRLPPDVNRPAVQDKVA